MNVTETFAAVGFVSKDFMRKFVFLPLPRWALAGLLVAALGRCGGPDSAPDPQGATTAGGGPGGGATGGETVGSMSGAGGSDPVGSVGGGSAADAGDEPATGQSGQAGLVTDAQAIQDAPPHDQVIAMGKFTDKNETGSGDVTIIRKANGSLVLHFANFQTGPGPDVYVYLTKNTSPGTQAQVELGFVSLGPLQGTQGNFDYPIPAGTDLKAYPGVIVYCLQYHSVFCTAAPK